MAHTDTRPLVLDLDSSESSVYGDQEGARYKSDYRYACCHWSNLPDLSPLLLRRIRPATA